MNTIEWLNVATLFQSLENGDNPPKWVCYEPKEEGQTKLPALVKSLFCPINDEQILILGGMDKQGCCRSEAFLFQADG